MSVFSPDVNVIGLKDMEGNVVSQKKLLMILEIHKNMSLKKVIQF